MKQKSYNKKQAIRAFTLGMRGDAVHGAGPGGMSQFARHVTKHLKESVNEASLGDKFQKNIERYQDRIKKEKEAYKKAREAQKKKNEDVNESSYTQRSILDFIKANKAAVESDPANIPRIKVFGPKQDSKYLNISLAGLAKIAKMVKNESVNEAKKSSYTKDGKLIITKARWLRLPDYAKLRKKGVEHVLSIDPKKKGRSKYIPVQIESVNEALKVVGSENVGTKKYDGKVWYWPHDYRHYLRDASFKQRKAVHNAWVKIGVPVKKTKDGEKWLEPKSNQKKKAWTIVRKAIAPKELGTPIPESVNEKISKEEWAQYPKYARKLKPYLQKLFKVPLKVRVIKHAFSNPWIEIRVAKFGKDIIPNDFRVKAAKAIGASNVRDWDNVNYGNIRVNSISLKHDIWVKLLGNKVKV